MSRVLAVDGVVYRVLAAWWGWVRVGLVWWVGCLPVVTAPVMTIWLLHVVRLQLDGRTGPTPAETLRFVRRRFVPALALAGLHLAVLALVAVAALGPSPGGVFDVVLPAAVLGVGVTWALVAPWSLVLFEQRGDGVFAAVRPAYVRAMRRPLLALGAAGGVAACAAMVLLGPQQIALLVLLTSPAAVAVLLVRTCDHAASASTRTVPSPRKVLS